MLQNIAQTRVSAFFIHLAFSALIAFTIILAAILVWYPDYLLTLTGAKKIFSLIILVDVCIGPILTLIVFNKKKPELGRDLFIIFLIQICALVYGMYTIAIARPVYIVFSVDRFELVQANDIGSVNLKRATEEKFKRLPLYSPKWIGTKRPVDQKEKEELLFGAASGGYDLAQLPKYYINYSDAITEIKKSAISIKSLKEFNPDQTSKIQNLIKMYPDNEYGYLPLSSKQASLTVIIKRETGNVVEVNELNPWN